ncbi:response regulator transcription factor [Clostridium sp. YIM B02506]|uniref:response regulator transcription factor n=1 Tax=Clostridium sp. YIM B02506 TaxID=2910680 RepID=UPI001EEEB0A1
MNNKYKILIVDDEQNILDVCKVYLEKEGFTIITAIDGESALNIYNTETLHLIILDLMLPKISGEKLCTTIRESSNIPIIMLTAKVDENERIEGISMGADDYLTKPFSVRELVVRVKALLKRTYKNTIPVNDVLIFNNGDLEVDINKVIVRKQGLTLNLTTNEFKVLTTFITNYNQVLTREQIVNKAFGMDYEGFDRTIDTYIKNIRQKIETNPKEPKYIITIYGMGYKFIENVDKVIK